MSGDEPPAARTIVVTGTDTGIGKTFAACALLRRARAAGLHCVGWKPVASGCEPTVEGLRNEDALALRAAAASALPYERINPYAFAEPIAPHLAAREAGVTIDRAFLAVRHAELAETHELVLVEGAGGWRVPLDEGWDFADWVAESAWPVVLVVGIRLGCLNHALLSVESIARRTALLGWVANCLPPLAPRAQDNIDSLRMRIEAPLLAVLPPHAGPGLASAAYSERFIATLRGQGCQP